MSDTYRIAEVAERSGFSAATLRYYEGIGLLAPAGRTEAGYRLYDDASLARLRFIARAKQLGCSLDEIAELVSLWEGGQCAHVQQQLRGTVAAKISAAHTQIAALTAFTAELQRAAASLGTHTPAGPCDDRCGCTTTASPASMRTAVPLARGVPESGPAIACTLDAGRMSARVAEWAAALEAVVARQAVDGGLRLELGPAADVAEVARLAAAEQGCCGFFRFALTVDDRGVALEVRAPAEAGDVVTALFGAAA
jgi:MerR family copper efflux transcriptional regulator